MPHGTLATLAVGLFAMGEALYVASRYNGVAESIEAVRGSLWMTLDDWRRSWKAWLRGVGLGFPIGALPAGGGEPGSAAACIRSAAVGRATASGRRGRRRTREGRA